MHLVRCERGFLVAAARSATQAPQPTSLERLVDDYLMACRAKGLSPNTVDNAYGYPLRGVLLPWCARRNIVSLVGFDARAVDALSVSLLEEPGRRGRPLSRHSVHAYIRAVRGFLTWAQREGETVAARPALPRLPRRVIDVLDRDEVLVSSRQHPANAIGSSSRSLLTVVCATPSSVPCRHQI